jgi:Xaa-Pro aminopeptidase
MNLSEIQAALEEEQLDGWLFVDHHLRDPLAYRILEFEPPRTPTRRWYYLIPAEGEPRALVHRIESRMLDKLPGQKTEYSGWAEQTDGLRSLLSGCRAVAMQYSPNCAIPYVAMVDAGTVELVRSLGVEARTSADLVQRFEARWSKEQLESHLEAGRRVDEIRRDAFRRIGDSIGHGSFVDEFQIKRFILDAFAINGLITDHGPIVAVNENASDPHYEPTDQMRAAIRRGDWVLIDLWAKLAEGDSVYYDVTWTGYCGEQAPAEIEKVFHIVRKARDQAIERVRRAAASRAVLRGFEVDDAARDFIKEHGYGDQFIHRTGHSIGREVHGAGANMDNLETHDERRIIPGACFSIEPGVYLPEFGVRSEVNVYVGDGEAFVTGEVQDVPVLI